MGASTPEERDQQKRFAEQILRDHVSGSGAWACKSKLCRNKSLKEPEEIATTEPLKEYADIGERYGGPTLLFIARELLQFRKVSPDIDDREVIDLIEEIHRAEEHQNLIGGCPFCAASLSGPVSKNAISGPPWIKEASQ